MESVLARGKKNQRFLNGRKEISSQELYFIPDTIDELRQIIVAASINKKNVQVKGKKEDLDDFLSTEDYLVSLLHLNKVIKTDVQEKIVTVQTGIDLCKLEDHLNQCGLSLPMFPLPPDVCLHESLSRGLHGSGWEYGILATYVTELELLTCTGETHTLSHTDTDDELFRCACVSLGALGIVTQVTLQCHPYVKVNTISYGLNLQHFLENLETHGKASDHLYVDWYPYTDHVMVHHPVHTQSTDTVHHKTSWPWIQLLTYILWIVYSISVRLPTTRPWMSKITYYIKNKAQNTIDDNHLKLQPYRNIEWVFPRQKTALVVYELQQHTLRQKLSIQFPVRLTFCRRDQIPMSVAYDGDICCLTIPIPRVEQDYSDVLKICDNIITSVGGFSLIATKIADSILERTYSMLQVDVFNKHRYSVDPTGMFLNNYSEKLLKT